MTFSVLMRFFLIDLVLHFLEIFDCRRMAAYCVVKMPFFTPFHFDYLTAAALAYSHQSVAFFGTLSEY